MQMTAVMFLMILFTIVNVVVADRGDDTRVASGDCADKKVVEKVKEMREQVREHHRGLFLLEKMERRKNQRNNTCDLANDKSEVAELFHSLDIIP